VGVGKMRKVNVESKLPGGGVCLKDAVTGDVTLHTRVNGRRRSPERN